MYLAHQIPRYILPSKRDSNFSFSCKYQYRTDFFFALTYLTIHRNLNNHNCWGNQKTKKRDGWSGIQGCALCFQSLNWMEEWSPAAHIMTTLFFLPLRTVYFQTFLNTSYCHKSRWHYWICLDSQSITTGTTEGSVLQKPMHYWCAL